MPLTAEKPAAASPAAVVVAVGLDEESLAYLRPHVPATVTLTELSWLDPIDKVVAALNAGHVIFVGWDGRGGRAHKVLAATLSQGRRPGIQLHAVSRQKIAVDEVPERQAKAMGIVDWIELPARAFQIQRALHSIGPATADDGPDDDALEQQELRAKGRRLKLDFSRAPRPEEVLRRAVEALREPAADPNAAKAPFPRVAVVHPDESFAAEITRRLTEAGAQTVSLFTGAEAAMNSLRRRRHDAILLWCDKTASLAWQVLEQLLEARHLPTPPVLVLVPDQDTLKAIAPRLSVQIVDTIAVYDRRPTFIAEAMAALKRNVASTTSARALLERLRAPLRPSTSPEARRTLDVAALEALRAQLEQLPGKRYWATLEETTLAMLLNNQAAALAGCERLRTLQPQAFSTLTVTSVYEALTGDRAQAAQNLVKLTLAFRELTADRLYRSGALLARWGAWEPLADLLDAWAAHPILKPDAQALYLAGLYYDATERRRLGLNYLCRAVDREPLRPDLAEGLGRHLLRDKRFDLAATALKLSSSLSEAPWEARVDLARALIGDRRIRDAERLIAALAAASPQSKDVQKLQASLSPTVTPVTRA